MADNFSSQIDSDKKTRLIPPGILWPFILLTSMFACWGLPNNLTDTLLPAFKRILSMSDSKTATIQVVCYLFGYGCLAIPASIYIKRFSYKSGVLLGLGLYASGAILFLPAAHLASFPFFLFAIWILFSGLSILETAANPYILSLGPEENATRRLNFAQSFNPIGAILGVVISQIFILDKLNTATAEERAKMAAEKLQKIQAIELNAVSTTYLTLGIVMAVLWLLIATNKKMPKTHEAGGPMHIWPSFKRLVRNRHYMWGVWAQFFYVGAQIGVWSFTVRYAMVQLKLDEMIKQGKVGEFQEPIHRLFTYWHQFLAQGDTVNWTAEKVAASYYITSLILFFIFRFVCTYLMKYIRPRHMLAFLGCLAAVLFIPVIYVGGIVGIYALVIVSGCMSLMFPTIFGLSVRGLGEDTKIASSLQIMAIAGAAVITQIEGFISDAVEAVKPGFGINAAFLVPMLCFAFIAYYGAVACRKDLPETNSQ